MGMVFFTYIACEDEFLTRENNNNINSSSFYKSSEDAVKAVNSVYAGLQRVGLYHRSIFFMLDFSSDEVAPTSNTQTPPTQLIQYTWDATNEHIVNFWQDSYRVIARANFVLLNVPNIPAANANEEALLARTIGEAKFLRGLAYLNLAANFIGPPDLSTAGSIPLSTEENMLELQLAGSGGAAVYAQIEKDFTDAIAVLPETYGSADKGRATSGAAKGLLGRAYLYQKKYGQAYAILKQIIDSGDYSLLANPRHIHDGQHENNAESLFEVQFTAGLNGGGGAWAVDENTGWGGNGEGNFRPIEYGTDGHAFYNAKPSPALIAAYQANDPRLEAFYFGPNSKIFLPADNADKTPDDSYSKIFARAGYAFKKYQNEDLRATGGRELDDGNMNIIVIRYADVLLMAAEALIEQNIQLTEAAGYINQVRRRADPSGAILPDISGTQAQLRDFLRQERRLELAAEQVRRIDIIRWGLGPQVFGNKFVAGKHEKFPIPQNELDSNKLLEQSPEN